MTDLAFGGPEVCGALAKAQAELRGVANDARNTHHRYTYTSAEALIGAVTDAIASHGLSFVCVSQTVTPESVARCVFYVVHESGQTIGPFVAELLVVPGKGRPADKAALGSFTECHAYALRGAFNIPRAEPQSVSGRDDSQHEERPTMNRRPRAASAEEEQAKGELAQALIAYCTRHQIDRAEFRRSNDWRGVCAAAAGLDVWPDPPSIEQMRAAASGIHATLNGGA